jgi:hypothetical protein
MPPSDPRRADSPPQRTEASPKQQHRGKRDRGRKRAAPPASDSCGTPAALGHAALAPHWLHVAVGQAARCSLHRADRRGA